MLRSLRNLTVNFIAAFIRDRGERHKFRNKYKIKSKFRKLRDDNRRLFNDNKTLEIKLNMIQGELRFLKNVLINHTWLNPLEENPKIYLSIACIAKNEGRYIREWIEYHKIVGVERFYFYDNESDDNTKEVLEPYIKDGDVIYRYVVGKVMQNPVYQDAILKARGQTRWLALIDLDEFIVPIEKDSIPEFLKDFEQYPAVGINRLQFDHNGHETYPTDQGGLVTANYTRVPKDPETPCNQINLKSIVNPNELVFVDSPHTYTFKNYHTVTENFEPTGQRSKFYSANKIRINHYAIRSLEGQRERVEKGSAWHRYMANYKIRETHIFEGIETTQDLVIQRYLPQLKIAMGITY